MSRDRLPHYSSRSLNSARAKSSLMIFMKIDSPFLFISGRKRGQPCNFVAVGMPQPPTVGISHKQPESENWLLRDIPVCRSRFHNNFAEESPSKNSEISFIYIYRYRYLRINWDPYRHTREEATRSTHLRGILLDQ